ncbi:MAG: hypothetical protein HYX29_07270 [Solirubrobacterales bacterium]|nr:hypothetical protein [Solirubrobacterales bacterium]
MARRLATTALLAVCSLFVFSTAASAKSLCVDTAPPQLAGCDQSFSYDAAGLDAAVDDANSSVGDDVVRVAAGDLILNSAVTATMQPGLGATRIVGAGRDQTKLQLQTSDLFFTGISFDATAQPSSSISELTVAVPSGNAAITGINVRSGTLSRTRFAVTGTDDFFHAGLVSSGSGATTISESEFELFGGDAAGVAAVVAGADVVLSKVSVKGASPMMNGQRGVVSNGTDPNVLIDASRFENLDPALQVEKGNVKVLDSLMLNPPGDSDTAIQFASSGATDAELITSGLTVVGARTGVDIATATPSPNVDINNSIFQTAGAGAADIACAGSVGFEPDVTVRVSILSMGPSPPSCNYNAIGTIDRLATPPVFAGPADFRPAAGSPQIDAGEVIYPTMMGDPSSLVDLAGATRLVDGNSDGTARLDIGAYEYQLSVAPIAGPVPPAPKLALSFGKVVGKFKIKRKPAIFTLTTAKKKPRLPVTSNLATPVELTLARSQAGYISGKKCVKKKPTTGKKKRCDIPLKGKLTLKLPTGTSYFTFSGKWNKKKLKPGKYALTLRAPGSKDSIKSVLDVIR